MDPLRNGERSSWGSAFGATLFDISAAFPSVTREGLRAILVELGLPVWAERAVRSLMANSDATVYINVIVHTGAVAGGIRQGCPTSGSIWALLRCSSTPILRRLTAALTSPRASLTCFADDLAASFIPAWGRTSPIAAFFPRGFRRDRPPAQLHQVRGRRIRRIAFVDCSTTSRGRHRSWRWQRLLTWRSSLGQGPPPPFGTSRWLDTRSEPACAGCDACRARIDARISDECHHPFGNVGARVRLSHIAPSRVRFCWSRPRCGSCRPTTSWKTSRTHLLRSPTLAQRC